MPFARLLKMDCSVFLSMTFGGVGGVVVCPAVSELWASELLPVLELPSLA